MVAPVIAPLPHTVHLPAYVPEPSETEAPLAFPAPPTVYAGIPATFPISYSQITGEFGGTSLRTAANNAGLPAGAVSFSSFAGMNANEGTGTFTAGYYDVWDATGYSGYYALIGSENNLKFPSGAECKAFYQSLTDVLTIWSESQYVPNSDATFHSVIINGVKLIRADATFTIGATYGEWKWKGVPANTIVNGVTYEPNWRTS